MKLLRVLVAALALGGCEAVMVANMVGNLLAPSPPRFAPTQGGPFRARTAADDMSPVLDKVAGADISDKCKENLAKVQPAATVAAEEGDPSEPSASPPVRPATVAADDGAATADPASCTQRWVCLPAQDYPLLTTFCPQADTADAGSGTPPAPARDAGEWAWDWDQTEYYE